MRLSLPEKRLRDDVVWGFRSGFDDEAYLQSQSSPRQGERFGDAAAPVPDGRRLDEIVRSLCREYDVCQPFIWAKLEGETGFVSAKKPAGKGYKAPMGFGCPDGGADPPAKWLGVVPNIRGAVRWWGTFRTNWEWQRRIDQGMPDVNTSSEGSKAKYERVFPRTAAEVGYLIYTPHLYSLHDFHALLAGHFPDLGEADVTPQGRFAEPIANMGSLPVNSTLHGRSVYRPVDVPGHNVFNGYSTWANNGHVGVGDAVDLMAPAGTEVCAIADGVQTRWQNDMTRKEVVYLEGDGWLAVYAHVNATHEATGVSVSRGEVVGRLRGDLSHPHLHFELWLGGTAVSAQYPGTLRDTMRARLGLTDGEPIPGDPRLIVAKPDPEGRSMDGRLYLEMPSRWDHRENCIEVETAALGHWLDKPTDSLPLYEHIREALKAMGVEASFDLTLLHSPSDPRLYVFVK